MEEGTCHGVAAFRTVWPSTSGPVLASLFARFLQVQARGESSPVIPVRTNSPALLPIHDPSPAYLHGKNMKALLALIPLAVLLLGGCNGSSSKSAVEPGPKGPDTGDTLRATGSLVSAEDAGYPFYVVTVAVAGQGERTFSADLSELQETDPATLVSWTGKEVDLTWLHEEELALMDVRREGRSLFGLEAGDLPQGMERISGTLSGALGKDGGDLPVPLRIHDPEGESLVFDAFVTPDLEAAEGSLVEGFYEKRERQRLLSIHPAGK